MAPPASRLRLHYIHPHDFAVAFAGAIVEHVGNLQQHFFGSHWGSSSPRLESTEIYRVVRELTAYARGELALETPVADYLGLLAPLYGSLLGSVVSEDPEDESPHTALGVVIHAAVGRERLARAEAVSVVQLAALAGVSTSLIEQLMESGELSARRDQTDDDLRVTAEAATRWLAECEVN